MAIPETDLLRIGRWCRERVPAHLWDQLRLECDTMTGLQRLTNLAPG